MKLIRRMMMNVNRVFLAGRLTRDPELKIVGAGIPLCSFSIASNRVSYSRDSDQKKEETVFIDCSAWRKTGETIQKYLKKGDPIFVEGHLIYESWEAQDGTKRSRLKLVIDSFQFVGRREPVMRAPGVPAEPSPLPPQDNSIPF
jgi:single-strand DNA-binding protein